MNHPDMLWMASNPYRVQARSTFPEESGALTKTEEHLPTKSENQYDHGLWSVCTADHLSRQAYFPRTATDEYGVAFPEYRRSFVPVDTSYFAQSCGDGNFQCGSSSPFTCFDQTMLLDQTQVGLSQSPEMSLSSPPEQLIASTTGDTLNNGLHWSHATPVDNLAAPLVSTTLLMDRPHGQGFPAQPPVDCGPSTSNLNVSPPPCSDASTLDEKLVPRRQPLRTPEDLYTPQYIRGQGHAREGWCGLCTPGRWLVLKNSAFWYDKTFIHGISATTGTFFDPPVGERVIARDAQDAKQNGRRRESERVLRQGLCPTCRSWIETGCGRNGKSLGVAWFKHASKCQQRYIDVTMNKPMSSTGRMPATARRAGTY